MEPQFQCPQCNLYTLAKQLSQLECSWCGYAEEFLEREQARQNVTPQARYELGLIETGIVLFGLYKLGRWAKVF